MILRILLIAKNMVCNLLKKVTSRLFRRPSHPATALPVYITQGSTAFKRGFVTVVDKNKLYHVANYGALYKTDLLVKNLNHYGKFCKRCGQMLDARFPLSSPSPNNIVVCLGCIRLVLALSE
jgi:hypothetical protein